MLASVLYLLLRDYNTSILETYYITILRIIVMNLYHFSEF